MKPYKNENLNFKIGLNLEFKYILLELNRGIFIKNCIVFLKNTYHLTK